MPQTLFFKPRSKTTRLIEFCKRVANDKKCKDYTDLMKMSCAHAAIEAARRAGTIDDRRAGYFAEKASEAFRRTDGYAFAGAGNGFQQITSADDFAGIAGGCLVAFLGMGDGRRKLSHVVVSLGGGRAAGLNNGRLFDRLPGDWSNMSIGELLSWQGNLAHLGFSSFEVWIRDLEVT